MTHDHLSAPTIRGREIYDVGGVKVVRPTETDSDWYCKQIADINTQLENACCGGGKYWYVGGIGRDGWLYGFPSTVISPEGQLRDVDLHLSCGMENVGIETPLLLGYPHMRCLSIDPVAEKAFLHFGKIEVELPYGAFTSYTVPFGDTQIQTFSPTILMCLMGLGYEISKPLRLKDRTNLASLKQKFGEPDPIIKAQFDEFRQRVRENNYLKTLILEMGVTYSRSRLGQILPVHRGVLSPFAKRVREYISSS